ncbi:protease complex subunit PrcB family protein [Paenibacillus sp. LHD-38]|uniref:protease complex subunit PrcB family protein n=1 Tax=Paenibacillus sp. LHD-38 TaxID=3072143 RepID=UPI0028102E11|nr:protease complex subunit PrcB family protein [Paenibacillus sp. LHD-38]MDQ8738229.1 protease complex subunit PrcB family protein [Paenibacillus sp. LHD-38]
MKKIFLVLVFVHIVLMGCSSQDNPNEDVDVESDIPFQIVNNVQFNFWIKEKAPQGIWFNETMANTRNKSGVERFDYGDKTYLLISSGEKPTGFYEVVLKEVINEEDFIKIFVEDRPPQRDEVPDMMENPRLLMFFERTDKEILLEWH